MGRVGPANGHDETGQTRRAVVLSTDCGGETDDQWAIAHLATSPAIELLGIVTTHAQKAAPPAETARRAVEEVLDHLALPVRPPIVAGASEPLPAGPAPRDNAGVRFILAQASGRSAADRLTVLAIGAATDVASALLLDPTLADRIEVVAMGFDAWPAGDDAWNVKIDIPAWQTVMASRVPLTVGDMAVCVKRLALTAEQGRAVLAGTGRGGQFLAKLLADFLDREAELAQRVTGAAAWPVWDEIVVAHLLGWTTFVEYPRPVLRADMSFDHSGGAGGSVRWITDVDANALWSDLARRLREHAPA